MTTGYLPVSYMSDPKGIGALLLAATEMETAVKGRKRVS